MNTSAEQSFCKTIKQGKGWHSVHTMTILKTYNFRAGLQLLITFMNSNKIKLLISGRAGLICNVAWNSRTYLSEMVEALTKINGTEIESNYGTE